MKEFIIPPDSHGVKQWGDMTTPAPMCVPHMTAMTMSILYFHYHRHHCNCHCLPCGHHCHGLWPSLLWRETAACRYSIVYIFLSLTVSLKNDRPTRNPSPSDTSKRTYICRNLWLSYNSQESSNSIRWSNLSEAFADDKETEQMSIDSPATHGITVQHLMFVTCTPQ